MIVNFFRVLHSILIAYLIFHVVNNESVSALYFYGELILTIIRGVLEKKIKHHNFKAQILASLVLAYYVFPSKFQNIGWLFLIKAIEVHKCLKAIRNSSLLLNSLGVPKYVAFTFDCLRYSVSQYIVLGIAMMIYRFLADSRIEPLPQNYAIMYQFVVTASTIGYGDVVPKSESQIIFLTYLIPIICGSFVLYINHLVEVFSKTFLQEQEIIQIPAKVE